MDGTAQPAESHKEINRRSVLAATGVGIAAGAGKSPDMSASVGRTLTWAWLLIVAAVINASFVPAEAHADPPGRLVYDMVVTAPGTRSQGWTATLYDPAGDTIEAEPGQTVTTPLGEFVRVPCVNPWDACGMIRTDMAEWMKTHQANVIMDSQSWVYRVYLGGEGSGSEVWTSRFLHDDAEISPDVKPIDTPMGPFRTGDPTATGWARAGWFPVSWQEPMPPGQPAA
jgi:hypothetical protein